MTKIVTRLATSAIHGVPLPERTPEQREATRERLRIERAREVKAIAKQKRRISRRQSIGKDWDGRAANDNIAWPLATALIREGNTELLKYAMMYRRIHTAATSNAVLGGSSVTMGDGMALDRHIHVRSNGSIAYKHVRQSTAASVDIPAKHATVTDSETQITSGKNESGYTNVPKQWRGDVPVNEMIDARHKLGRLQSALGYLCEPFELACIDGRTYAEVGVAIIGGSVAIATGAGRALVHTALVTLRDIFGRLEREDF
ncbi:hypothetical protein ACFOLL_12680 [Falsochrobactrum ovis]|uniref:Uncharacterized protein n=1 Tax=Falsochrobactrum ovis TaxID=1293442 RepID=A0A364JSQ6_9HYPH|nr:hypothetical protein [Falsochrobactrum ovis]RAK26362.1 hypothetical protein C7374_11447 [Falsochrobactrum ovis]